MTALAPITARLSPIGVRFTTTSLDLPADMRFNHWENLGDDLTRLHDANLWHLADWAAHGERYARTYDLDRFKKKTLWNLAHISRAIESSRRREDLSFSHHAEVAALEPDYQTAFLNDAAEKSWTRDELRDQVRAFQKRPGRQPALSVRATGDLYDLCNRAAQRVHMDPSAWAAAALEEAARRTLELR
jgi:hypothetical protein